MRYLSIILSLILAFSLSAEDKIGVILPLSGDFAEYGQTLKQGVLSAKSKDVKFIFEDEFCSASTAISAFRNLTSKKKISYLIGPFCGSSQLALAPLIKEGEQIAILGSSAPQEVYEKSGGRILSTQHSIEAESIFNAQKLYDFGYKRVVILFLENRFSRAHEVAFRNEFMGEVLETLTYDMTDAIAIKPIVLKIRRLKPDAIYVPDASPFIHGLIKELIDRGIGMTPVFSVYSSNSAPVIEAISEHGEGVTLSYPKIGEEEALEYFPKLASQILTQGISKCPQKDTECVLTAIRKGHPFDSFGILKGEMEMRVFSGDRFVPVDQLPQPEVNSY